MEDNDKLLYAAICTGGLIIFVSVLVVGAQTLSWLHDGTWPPVTILDAWHYAGYTLDVTGMKWRGIAKVISWIFDQSFAAALSLFGFCIVWLGSIGNT